MRPGGYGPYRLVGHLRFGFPDAPRPSFLFSCPPPCGPGLLLARTTPCGSDRHGSKSRFEIAARIPGRHRSCLPTSLSSSPPSRSGSGGCFPCHYDNPGPPNKRALTCLLYLNPTWKEGDGGEVCLRPFLDKEKAIAPLLDRLVGVGGLRALNFEARGSEKCGCLLPGSGGG